MRTTRRLFLIAVPTSVLALTTALAVPALFRSPSSSAGASGNALTTASTSWRLQAPVGFTPYEYHGSSCVKGTKTCWVVGGTFGAVPQIAKTTNGGQSWSPEEDIGPMQNGLDGISCPTSSRCVAVGAQMGQPQDEQEPSAVRTTNGGRSWSFLTMPASVFTSARANLKGVSCGSSSDCVAVGLGGLVITTTDFGSSWKVATSGTTKELTGASCPTATTCFAVGYGGTVLKSTDGGTSWSAETSPNGNDLYAVSCPTRSACVATGSSGTVIATTDGGSSWSPQTSTVNQDLWGVSCASTTSCVAAGASGAIVYTTDGGTLWAAGTSGSTATIPSIACYSTSGCVAGTSHVNSTTGADVLYTTDGGKSWGMKEPRTLVRKLGTTGGDSISCPAPTQCFAVGGAGPINGGAGADVIFETLDGIHWFQVYQGAAGTGALHAISCASTSDCIVTGYEKTANTGVILATTNGGVTWKSQTSGTSEKLWGVSCPAVSTCFILGNAGTILHTTDGGAVWTAQASGASDPLYGVSCPTTSVCVVVGERSTVLHTSNGGSTWVPQTSPVTTNLHGVSCHDTLHCVITGFPSSGNVAGILYTTDGGTTWKQPSPAISVPTNETWGLPSVSCRNDSDCTATGGTGFDAPGHPPLILSTTDGGAQWKRDVPPSRAHGTPGVSCTKYGCWATGFGGAIVSSFTPPLGYWIAGSNGAVAHFHASSGFGSPRKVSDVVGIAATPDGGGYWLAGRNGAVFHFGGAKYYGSARTSKVDDIVGIATTEDGRGYWLAGANGHVFHYGDAKGYGSARRVKDIVAIASTPDGRGYWLAGANGHVYHFGDAKGYGSASHLKYAIVAMATTTAGNGYWLAAANGSVFRFGAARFHGSAAHEQLASPIVGMAATAFGDGYWLVEKNGSVFAYGAAKWLGRPHVSDTIGMARF